MISRITSILQISLNALMMVVIYFERLAIGFRTDKRGFSPQTFVVRLELDEKTPDSHRG